MIIKLYIGAHKTATTHIQSILEYNQTILNSNQIKLSTPKNLRVSWLKNFLDYSHKGNTTLMKELQVEAPKEGIWILSDENIVGTPYEFMISKEGMYPNIKKRLESLRELFPNAKIELFFAIRSYDMFYRSTYLEVVRNRGYIPFEEYYNEEKFNNNSWKTVIQMFTEVIPQENITLWLYEDIKRIMPKIMNSITGLDNYEAFILNYPIKETRPSLSKKSLNVLTSLHPVLTQQESKRITEEINKKYPIGEKYSKFIAFNLERSQKFQEKYREDIKYIKNNYQKINFIGENEDE